MTTTKRYFPQPPAQNQVIFVWRVARKDTTGGTANGMSLRYQSRVMTSIFAQETMGEDSQKNACHHCYGTESFDSCPTIITRVTTILSFFGGSYTVCVCVYCTVKLSVCLAAPKWAKTNKQDAPTKLVARVSSDSDYYGLSPDGFVVVAAVSCEYVRY
jgi:hypothetical protein